MDLSLRRFEIKDGDIAFDNRQAKLKATLKGFNQSLSGDFSQKQVDVQTRLNADTVSVTFAGIPYLNRVKLGLTADARADLAKKTYVLKDTELSLNDLKLGVSGSAKSVGKLLGLDLAFKAPSTNFRSILSLVPAVYARDFDKVKTSGSFTMDGRVKGEYGDSAFPAFALNAKVNDAAFQYPDLPLPARSIFLDLALTNPGGSADSTVVKLDRFHLRIGRNPVEAAHGAPDPGLGSQRGSHGQGQAGSGRRSPAREVRGDRPAHRHRGGRRGGESPHVRHRQEAVRPGGGERHHGRRQSRAQGQDSAAPARDPAGVAPAETGAGPAHLVHRLDRQQRSPGVRLDRQPDLLPLPGRHPHRLGDGEEQPVRPGRVALGRGRPRDHPGAGQAGLHPERDRERADLRQAQDGRARGAGFGSRTSGRRWKTSG